jgi:hypothetical protein
MTARNFCITELVTANGDDFDPSSKFEAGYRFALDCRRVRCTRKGEKTRRKRR